MFLLAGLFMNARLAIQFGVTKSRGRFATLRAGSAEQIRATHYAVERESCGPFGTTSE